MPHPSLLKLVAGPFPVESFLDMDFYDGALSGFFRSNSLAAVSGQGADFVFGPARTNWYNELGYHWRMFLASPVVDVACRKALAEHTDRLLHSAEDSAVYQTDDPEHLPGVLKALLAPFLDAHSDPIHRIRGRFLCKFGEQYKSLEAWELKGSETMTQDQVNDLWPI